MEFTDKYVQFLKVTYPIGTRIMVDSMGYDPRPIEPGTMGTVHLVDDMGTIHFSCYDLIIIEDDFPNFSQKPPQKLPKNT